MSDIGLSNYHEAINGLKERAAGLDLLYSDKQKATLFRVDLSEQTDIRIDLHNLVERIRQDMKAKLKTKNDLTSSGIFSLIKGKRKSVPSHNAIMAEVMSELYNGEYTSSLASQGSLRNHQKWGEGLSSSALPKNAPQEHVEDLLKKDKKKLLEVRVCDNKAFSCFVEWLRSTGVVILSKLNNYRKEVKYMTMLEKHMKEDDRLVAIFHSSALAYRPQGLSKLLTMGAPKGVVAKGEGHRRLKEDLENELCKELDQSTRLELEILSNIYTTDKGQGIDMYSNRITPVISILIGIRLSDYHVNFGCKSGKDRAFVLKCLYRAADQILQEVCADGGHSKLAEVGVKTNLFIERMNSSKFMLLFAAEFMDSKGAQIANRNCLGCLGILRPAFPLSLMQRMKKEEPECYQVLTSLWQLQTHFAKMNKPKRVIKKLLKGKLDKYNMKGLEYKVAALYRFQEFVEKHGNSKDPGHQAVIKAMRSQLGLESGRDLKEGIEEAITNTKKAMGDLLKSMPSGAQEKMVRAHAKYMSKIEGRNAPN